MLSPKRNTSSFIPCLLHGTCKSKAFNKSQNLPGGRPPKPIDMSWLRLNDLSFADIV